MFIQTEATPNPATLKFLPGQVVLADDVAEFRQREDAEAHSPLAAKLFSIPGICGVFFGYDFVSVSKEDDFAWEHLKPAILGIIMEYMLSGEPVLSETMQHISASAKDGEEFYSTADAPLVDTIKQLIEERVRPAVANDGGDITFRGFEDGIVYLNMRGACAGCPASTATLKQGIENLLRHFIPEVASVEAMPQQ